MPRQLVAKAAFLRAYQRLSEPDQHLVDEALRRFKHYLEAKDAPVGLGVTHLRGHTYEFRAGLVLRIVYVAEIDQIVLSLLGTHDEVRRFLRRQ